MTDHQVAIVLRGLPGAGKSTWAAAWRDLDPQRRLVVNRDRIRLELFDVYSGLTAEQEAVVSDIESLRADRALRAGLSVAVDATNLESDYREVWVALAASHGVRVEIVTIDTPLDECLRRNRARGAGGGRLVPEDVIRGMHESGDLSGGSVGAAECSAMTLAQCMFRRNLSAPGDMIAGVGHAGRAGLGFPEGDAPQGVSVPAGHDH